jgi:hypothetical protein
MDKEEIHWIFGVVQGWFSAKLGSNNQWWIPAVSTISLATEQPQGHNKQEPTTFILQCGSNKQHHMDKEEIHWIFGVVQGWFPAKLGSTISNGSQLSAQFPCPPTATGT